MLRVEILRFMENGTPVVRGFFDMRMEISGFHMIMRNCTLCKFGKRSWIYFSSKKIGKKEYLDQIEFPIAEQRDELERKVFGALREYLLARGYNPFDWQS